MSRHRSRGRAGKKPLDYHELQALRRRAESRKKDFADHLDECRTCSEGAWNHELCPDGELLLKRLSDVNDELNWMGEL